MLHALYNCPSKKLRNSFEGGLTNGDAAEYLRNFSYFDVLNIIDSYYSTVTLQQNICLLLNLVEVNESYRSAGTWDYYDQYQWHRRSNTVQQLSVNRKQGWIFPFCSLNFMEKTMTFFQKQHFWNTRVVRPMSGPKTVEIRDENSALHARVTFLM